jgi:hypothetical protein
MGRKSFAFDYRMPIAFAEAGRNVPTDNFGCNLNCAVPRISDAALLNSNLFSLFLDRPASMRLLTHHQLDTQRVRAQFAKLQQAIARDDFKSPNLKKLAPTPYWRFKLDQTHRLLVQFARHGDETVAR